MPSSQPPSSPLPTATQPTARPSAPPPAAQPSASAKAAQVEIGAVLNGIYEVKRLIARGGMGEVFEGVNVNDDHDRVAIKVMLPSLAADANVQAMFRKEARTLTRLSHPAVVQYRVLAQEPSLGVFYIVTEFLDGEPLSDLVGRVTPSPAELRAFMRRMAEGLKSAHDLGAVHRDMSPDNILLPQSRLDRAKIIDFGIAKELDPSKATIVGDGFAGKLGYVAPEQFGDFGRDIGPWTDVYSLGLVVLTLAAGRNLDMGATLVDAVDKRRAGLDVTPAPPELRPILTKMLAADPTLRARSMDEVLAMLDGAPAAPTPPPAPAKSAKAPKPARQGGMKPMPLIFAGLGAVVIVGALAFILLAKKPAGPGAPPQAAIAAAGGGANIEVARRAIETALASVPCSWLNVSSVGPSGAGVAVKLTGVASVPAGTETAVLQAARAAGVNVPDVDSVEVQPVDTPACAPLDAFRAFRADTSVTGGRLSTSQAKYTLEKQPDGSLSQKAVITMAIGDPNLDFALYGLEPSGAVDSFKVDSRKDFQALEQDPRAKANIVDIGNDGYRLSVITSHAGLSGLLLLTGKGPFDPGLIATPAAQRGPDWAQRIKTAAQAGGWKAEMVWYRTADPGG
ncbi:MAG TPA: serine/threonine-protein kinase [Caulobacteraceae bacterium]